MNHATRRAAFSVILLVLGCAGCNKSDTAPAAGSSARPTASVAPKPKPWYVGRWSGAYRAERDVIDMTVKQGAPPAWGKDNGRRATGPGTLSLDVDDHGRITGTLIGPLGKLRAQGAVQGDQLRVRLSTTDPRKLTAFNGELVATRDGDAARGHLHVSTGDSLTLRDGPVVLRKGAKAPPAPPPPPPPPPDGGTSADAAAK